MLAVSLLASILFLGGWHGPLPVGQWLGLTFEHGHWYGIAGNVLGTLNVITKGVVGVTVMMWVRWTLPRLRIDQVITTCLKYCVPIAAVMFLLVTGWQYALPNRTFFGLREAPPFVLQLAELRPQIEAKPPAPTKPAPAATSQPVGGGDRTALVDTSRTK
jgi:NADH-quinone oxidoreductase subunit H